MKQLKLRWAFALLVALGLTLQARADTVNNSFDNGFNYVANGIIGDSFWDGVSLRFGDVAGGNAGGNGNGNTQVANTTDFPGFFNLVTSGTDWSAAGDDGFFLYRVVSGDFDVSAQVVPPYDNRGANFVGLMARAYQTNNSGAPFSPITTNNVENWVAVLRMNQFNFDGEIRQATNGANQEFTIGNAASNNTDTNTARFYRITRVGDTFSFFMKTNEGDAWIPLTNAANLASGSITRSDLNGVAMQVGIQASAFSTGQRGAFFDSFSLTGPNVTTPPAGPAAPSNVSEVSSNTSGSMTISWTPGAGSDGSLVLMRANGRNISQPVQGRTYTADTSFTNAATLLGAGRAHVVYVGSGNSVTVTGLGGTNNSYDVAVFSYSGTGASTVYNRDTVATNTFIGPGQVSGVAFTLNPPQIPAGGAAVAQVTATYTSGDSYDVSSDPSTIWTPIDPTIVAAGNGVVTGLTNGTTTVTATYAGVTGTNSVTVVSPAFVDNFDVTNDFVANGVLGSKWDGIYLGAGDIPFQVAGNLGPNPGIVTNCDANASTNGMLTVVHRQTGFEGNENDGFFLFKYVSGDFQAAVKIEGFTAQAFQIPGIMARQFAPGGGPAGTTNATFTHGRENHIRWSRFDEFNITTCSRRALNGGNQFFDQAGDGDASFWLLMVKTGTSFRMYRRVNPTDNWSAVTAGTQTLNATTNPVMQVGLQASTFDSGLNFRSVAFSHFMLDATNLVAPLPQPTAASLPSFVNNPDGSLTLNWTPGAGSVGSIVVMRAARLVNTKPAAGTTYTANSVFGTGSDLGSGNFVVYSGAGSTVTVTGLVPGTTYYAAVFSYSGTGATTSYNFTDTRQTNTLVLGQVQALIFTLPQGNRVLNGGVTPYTVLARYVGNITNDVTSQATLAFASNPDGWAAATNGFVTGITNGAVTITATFQSVSTNNSVTVFPPHMTDNFSTAHDYLLNGVQGIWDGIYLGSEAIHGTNAIPGSTGAGTTVIADSSVTTPNVLTVSAHDGNWAGTGNNGFLLWRYVPGDFQAAVQVASIDKTTNNTGAVGFQFSGLMGRAYGNTNDMTGVSYNGSEDWVYFGEFEQFNDSTESRHALNGADNENAIFDGATNDFYLLMKRQGGTFTFFRRVNPTDPWLPLPQTTIVRGDLVGVPLQVGLFQATYSPNTGTTKFANFMLDDAPPTLGFGGAAGGSMNVNIPAIPLLQLQSASVLTSPTWLPVTGLGAPGVTNGLSTLSVPIVPGANQFFRSSR